MGRHLHPIILHHVLQCFVASQGGQSPLHCEVFYLIYLEIIHAECFKSQVLLFNTPVSLIYLRQQICSLQFFEWTVVEFKDLEILSNPPRILVTGVWGSSYFVVEIHQRSIYQPTWNNACEKINNFVDCGCTFEIVSA